MYEKREQKRNLLQYDASGRNDPGIEYVWNANGRLAVLAGDSNSSQGWTSIFNGKGLPLPGWRFLDLKKL